MGRNAQRTWWLLGGALAAACGDIREDDEATATSPSTTVATMATNPTTDPSTDPATGEETTASADATDGMTKLDVGFDTDGAEGDVDGIDDCMQDVDIVFVMDVSTSMGPILSTLADEILVVDEAIAALGLANPPHYGLVVFVDDAAILNMGAPYADVATLRADFMQWSAFTSSNQQVNGGNANSTWPENSLDALFLAGAGFQWRPAGDDTLRMIIHTTDDTFWDGPTNGNGLPIAHGYDEVVDTLQQGSIRTFTFSSQIGGSCECEDVTPGWSTPYQGKPTIPEATDGSVFDLDLVLAGQLSLSAAINGAIDETMCEPYTPVG
jgi:hypothetical protein